MIISSSASVVSGEGGSATICVSLWAPPPYATKSSLSIGCVSCRRSCFTTPLVGARMSAFQCHDASVFEISPLTMRQKAWAR